MKELNNEFLDLLKEKGYTKAQFARAVGVNWQAVWQWLNKIRFPSKKSKEKMSDILGVSVEYLDNLFKNKKCIYKDKLKDLLYETTEKVGCEYKIIQGEHKNTYELFVDVGVKQYIIIAKYNTVQDHITILNASIFVPSRELLWNFIEQVKTNWKELDDGRK